VRAEDLEQNLVDKVIAFANRDVLGEFPFKV